MGLYFLRHMMFVIFVFFSAGYSAKGDARPVSYPDGWTVMLTDNDARTSLHMHYTPSIQYSIGYRYEDWKDKEYASHYAQRNQLLKRWNRSHSQANLYLKTALGVASLTTDESNSSVKPSAVISLAGDWETRRYFTSFESRYIQPSVTTDFFRQSVRVGIAPYIGDYGDLHTWLMLQWDYRPELDATLRRTLQLRFFKGVQLLEVGITSTDELSLNYILRI